MAPRIYCYCETCGARATVCCLHDYAFRVLECDRSLARIRIWCFACQADRFHSVEKPRRRELQTIRPHCR